METDNGIATMDVDKQNFYIPTPDGLSRIPIPFTRFDEQVLVELLNGSRVIKYAYGAGNAISMFVEYTQGER